MVIFLGGTCNKSTWREELIPKLEAANVKYYNPVVKNWTQDCIDEENRIKNSKDTVNLFVITKEMVGVYSIAEVTESACMCPERTVFCYIRDGLTIEQKHSLATVAGLVEEHGGHVIEDPEEILWHKVILDPKEPPQLNGEECLEIYNRAIKLWGEQSQIGMMMEECSELIKVLNKYARGKAKKEDVMEEVIDVQIVCMQMHNIFGGIYSQKIYNYKMDRLKKLIESQEI